MHDQEVARKTQFGDDFQLVLDLPVGLGVPLGGAVAPPARPHREFAQPAVLGVPGGHVERRQLRARSAAGRRHTRGPARRRRAPRRVRGEQPRHLRPGSQMRAAGRREPSRGLVQALPRAHRAPSPWPAATRRLREVRAGGGHHRQPNRSANSASAPLRSSSSARRGG